VTPHTIPADPMARPTVIGHLVAEISALEAGKAFDVTLSEQAEDRRACQNRLLWAGWNRAYADATGHSVKWVHGAMKNDLLLPIKRACDHEPTRKRAEFEHEVLSLVADREKRIAVAYDFVRSRDIPVRLFAEWLSEYQRHAVEGGIILESTTDDARYALMEITRRAA